MNLLADTHIILWALGAPDELSQDFQNILQSPRNQIYVSSITICEIITEIQIGKLTAPIGFEQALQAEGFQFIEFSLDHAMSVRKLPLHHRDPFDRALLGQALSECFELRTADKALNQYSDTVKIRQM